MVSIPYIEHWGLDESRAGRIVQDNSPNKASVWRRISEARVYSASTGL